MDDFVQETWPHFGHALLGIFFTEEALKEDHEKVTSQTQAELEDEDAFGSAS